MNTWRMCLVLISLTLSSAWANAQSVNTIELPEVVRSQYSNLQIVGSTRLNKFGFHIYDASYWVGEQDNYKEPIRVLSIEYARNIKREKLLSSTKKEWQRLKYTKSYPTDVWLSKLKEIWPDVNKGDQLVIVSHPSGNSSFFNSQSLLGEIEDPEFGPSFLAIWIDKRARFGKNRKELLGGKIK